MEHFAPICSCSTWDAPPAPPEGEDAVLAAAEHFTNPGAARLLVEVLRLAVADLKAAFTPTPTQEERLNAASAAFFFLRGAGSLYLRALGLQEHLPRFRGLARDCLAAMRHNECLIAVLGDQEYHFAMSASRADTAIRRLGVVI